jgi:ABC-2 type transport system permease protein
MTALTEATETPISTPPDRSHAGSGSSLRHWWSDTLVFAGRNIEHIRQIPEKLLDVTIQPLMFVLLFAYVFGGAIAIDGGNYREYLIGGILIQTLAFGLTGPATAISTDLTEGVIDRFRSLPANKTSYLSGHFLAELAGMAVAVVVLLTAGVIIGWGIHNDAVHVTGAFLLVFVFSSAMIWIGTYIGLAVRTPDAVMGVAFIVVFPLTFLSNAFVPISSMPEVLQWVAAWNPVSVVVAAIREMFGNPTAAVTKHTWPLDHPVPAAFLYCGLILLIAVPASIRRYRARTSD